MKREELFEGFDYRQIFFGEMFALNNRLQAAADTFFEEITCKQFFLLICLSLFRQEPPTIKELAKVMGSSHQNVKQIALKLEKNGIVNIYTDEKDRRKQRVVATKKLAMLDRKYEESSRNFMEKLYEGIPDEDTRKSLEILMKMEDNLKKMKGEE